MSDKEESNSSIMILAGSILFSTLLLSGVVFFSANNVATSLSGLSLNAAPNQVQATPTPIQEPDVPEVLSAAQVEALYAQAAATLGDEDAKVTILEFSDYQCPFCRRHFNTAAKQILSEYVESGKVKIAWLDFPLSFHPMAVPSANAVRCAGEQGKYWEAHDAVFEGQNQMDPVQTVDYKIEDVKKWIAGVDGINTDELNACIDSGKYASEVTANFNAGVDAGIQGTPGFIINGVLFSGAQPIEAFRQVIDAQLN
ncbi:DsbA family protein [Candidatus Micrarchaeota archaeon]|nr:DsbA family protein [Candidatus Micrarchaeota archaeon]